MGISLREKMPVRKRGINPDEETIELLRRGVDDENMWSVLEENFITYMNVFSSGKYSAEEYINAVKYVSFKLMGYTNNDAYKMVFPERYKRIYEKSKKAKCSADEYVGGFVAAYNKGQLVTKIMEQSLIPSYILNAPLHQKAINTLAEVISDPHVKSMAKVKACEVLLDYTKPPETIRHELNLSDSGIDVVSKLKEAMDGLADTLDKSLNKDVITLKQVAEGEFVQGEE